jgi:hypothetical protein
MDCPNCGIQIRPTDLVCIHCQESTILPTVDWEEVYGHYHRLEKSLIDYFEYVPFETKHYNVFSPKLFDLYLQIGVGIEQQLMYIYNFMYPNQDVPQNIRLLFGACNKEFMLKKIIISVHYSKPTTFRPFHSLNITNETLPTHPDFKIYSEYKHEWIEMIKMTTLKRTVKFLAMYFILLCQNPSIGNFEFLRNIGILRKVKPYEPTKKVRPDGLFFNQYRDFLSQHPKKKQWWPYMVVYESRLFHFEIDLDTIPKNHP